MDDWLEIGTIVAPQGLRGELRVYPSSDFPERFEVPGKRWLLRPGETEPQPVELVRGQYLHGKSLYSIKLAGIDNRNQSEELRGCKLMVPSDDIPELEAGEYHVRELIGLSVFMQESGKLLGEVISVIPAGNDLLEVKLLQEDAGMKKGKKSSKTVLIPFVDAIVPVVDLAAGRIEITPPEGLLEINN
jgi:16S rRNA processing protein RimM